MKTETIERVRRLFILKAVTLVITFLLPTQREKNTTFLFTTSFCGDRLKLIEREYVFDIISNSFSFSAVRGKMP